MRDAGPGPGRPAQGGPAAPALRAGGAVTLEERGGMDQGSPAQAKQSFFSLPSAQQERSPPRPFTAALPRRGAQPDLATRSPSNGVVKRKQAGAPSPGGPGLDNPSGESAGDAAGTAASQLR